VQGDAALFRYLNRDGAWPGFHWDGLELTGDGSLRLTSVPRFSGTLPDGFSKLPQPGMPAGIAADRDGTVYFTSSGSERVLRVNGCNGVVELLPRLDVEVKSPGALLLAADRRILFVADLGRGQVLWIDA